jgi:hypothetical protein
MLKNSDKQTVIIIEEKKTLIREIFFLSASVVKIERVISLRKAHQQITEQRV